MAHTLLPWWRRWLNRFLFVSRQRPRRGPRRQWPWLYEKKRQHGKRRVARPLQLECFEDRTLLSVGVVSHFSGLSLDNTAGYVPPDSQGAAGPSNVVETVNQTIGLYHRTGGAPTATDSLTDFWTAQGGLIAPDGGAIFSDPVVVWDPLIQRFIVGDQNIDFNTHVSALDLAVSTSSDPKSLTKSDWNFYQVSTTEKGNSNSTTFDADYPGNLGYNADALVFTLNMFAVNGSTVHSQINTININSLLNATTLVKGSNVFQTDYNGFSVRPTAMQDSKTGDPMWFVTEHGDNKSIDVLKMTNVLSSSPTLTTTNLAVNPYVQAVPELQPDGTPITTNTDSRIINAAEDNNLLVAAHSVSNSATSLDEVQWYEINVQSGTPVLKQQGDVSGGAGTYYAYPGIDINAQGDIGMSFVGSGTHAGQFMSTYVTGRTPTETAGTMETPIRVQAGTGNDDGDGREGDLSGINLDSDGTFWAVNEFARNSSVYGGESWGTAVVHFMPSTYVVTSTADTTAAGTLLSAINAVNAGQVSEIYFAIPVGGVQTINLTSALPAITKPVYIDGLSQGGARNTTPRVELNGASAGSGSDGLLLDASGCSISGLIIENFGKNGIEVAASNNTLGGTTTGAGNVISGNTGDGILIDSGVSGTQVQGNKIGASGLANGGFGIDVLGSNNTIGGGTPRGSNTLAFNSLGGVNVSTGAGNVIRRNSLFANGTNATGPGIVLAGGGNNSFAGPNLTSATLVGTTLTVKGTFTAPAANVSYVLEFYANPTGDAEGKVYLGLKIIKPATTGTQSFTFTVTTSVTGTDPIITATVTDASGDTSAFSNGVTG